MNSSRAHSSQEEQRTADVVTQVCGFVTIVAGTFLLHATRNLDIKSGDIASLARPKVGVSEGLQLQELPGGGSGLRRSSSGGLPILRDLGH